jgi:CSLREA domain-containing protein
LALAVLAALWLMPGGLALAATITVTTVADENGTGPNCSLREAIASANGDADVGGCVGVGAYGADTIVFGSTLSLPATITLTDPAGALTVSSDVTITGPGATQLAIDGNHTTRVFSITTGQVMMSGLTIQHGNSALTPDNALGGGIYNTGTLTLTNCTLSGNSAAALVEGFELQGYGGCIYNTGTLTLTNCTLSSNSAAGYGGGIYNLGMLTLANCTLSGNSADGVFLFLTPGGGILNANGGSVENSGTLTVSNSTFLGNRGGGIESAAACAGIGCNPCGSVAVTNSTFSGNGADTGAGGIDGPCPASLTNSIIASSSGANCGAGIIDGGHNLQFPGTDCGATIQSLDPLLDPAGLKDNGGPTQTIALLPGSPAINAGDPAVCAGPPVNGVDQRGFARPGTGHTQCSIGAYEADGIPSETCTGDCDGTGSVTVDEIITLVNIALGNAAVSDCDVGDANDDGQITVDEILTAVNVALNGCPIPDVSGTRQRDQAAIVSSTCAAGVNARVQNSINAGEWNCTYDIAQSGPNLTITETCPDGTDTFPGTVDNTGHITVLRTEQETEGSCTFTQASRFEANGGASSSTGTGRLQFDFSTGCAFTDCEMVVESRFSRP